MIIGWIISALKTSQRSKSTPGKIASFAAIGSCERLCASWPWSY